MLSGSTALNSPSLSHNWDKNHIFRARINMSQPGPGKNFIIHWNTHFSPQKHQTAPSSRKTDLDSRILESHFQSRSELMGLVIRLETSRLRMKQWRCSSLAPEVGWLMSKRPQKCNLISSVNLDRKWPKQNWFELRNISMSPCHILTAPEKSAANVNTQLSFAVI